MLKLFRLNSKRAGLLGWAVGGLLLAACGESDSATKAVRQARNDLGTLAARSTKGAPGSTRKVSYEQIVKDLSGVENSGRPGEQTAAGLLTANAKSHLAQLKAEAAAIPERQALDRISVVRSAHVSWLHLMATAKGLVSYDPKPALDDLGKQIQAKDQEIAEGAAAQQTAKKALADLEAKASTALEKARAQRDQEAALRQSGSEKSETQREVIIKQAMEVRRKGNDFDKEASMFKADAAKVKPDIEGGERRLANLRDQRSLLDKSKESVNRVVRVNAAAAARTRKDADTMGAEIAAWLAQLKELRGQVAQPSGEAAALYTQAASEAKKSNTVRRGGAGGLAQAAYEQARGDVLLARARGLHAYAALLQALATGGPPMTVPGLADDGAAAQKSFDEALANAKEAYTSAKGLYEGAGGGEGAVPGRLKYIAGVLEKIAGGTLPPPDAAPADSGAGAEKGSEGAAPDIKIPTPIAVSGNPEQEIRALFAAVLADVNAGKFETLRASTYTKTDAEKKVLDAGIEVIQKEGALNEACKSKFGKDFGAILEENARSNPVLGSVGSMLPTGPMKSELAASAAPDSKINIKSDTEAEVITPKSPSQMIKVNGKWLIRMDAVPPQEADKVLLMLSSLSDLMNTVTADINAGTYPDAKAMANDFGSQAMKAMMKVQGPGPK